MQVNKHWRFGFPDVVRWWLQTEMLLIGVQKNQRNLSDFFQDMKLCGREPGSPKVPNPGTIAWDLPLLQVLCSPRAAIRHLLTSLTVLKKHTLTFAYKFSLKYTKKSELSHVNSNAQCR